MKNSKVVAPFVEGFKGAFHLTIDIFVAVGSAFAGVVREFVNRPAGSDRPNNNARMNSGRR